MIRTDIVELTVISAVAYRQKLTAGGSGITILRYDTPQPGIASISKTSGEPIPTANTPADLYPAAAFKEAMTLTLRMPYSKRGNAKLNRDRTVEPVSPPEEEKPAQEEIEEEVLVDSGEYQKVVAYYTDKDGRLSYELLNRDLIRFAHASRIVRAMTEEGKPVKKIRAHIVAGRFRTVTGNRRLTEKQAVRMGELLDEVSPKSAFKALDAELRKKSAAAKHK